MFKHIKVCFYYYFCFLFVLSYALPQAFAATLTCPSSVGNVYRGSRDTSTNRSVSSLQKFLADKYGVSSSLLVTGTFGSITESYLKRFQKENNFEQTGSTGPLTRAALHAFCGKVSNYPIVPLNSVTPIVKVVTLPKNTSTIQTPQNNVPTVTNPNVTSITNTSSNTNTSLAPVTASLPSPTITTSPTTNTTTTTTVISPTITTSPTLTTNSTATVAPTPNVIVLTSGVSSAAVTSNIGTNTFYSIVVPAGATNLTINTSGRSGDDDFYVSLGSQPSAVSGGYTWAGATAATNEYLSIPNPVAGTYYITLNAYSAINKIKTTATYTVPAPTPTPTPTSTVTTLTNGITSAPLTATIGSNTFYSITVPTGTTNLTITTVGGTGDDDLYVKLGSQPATTGTACSWNARDYTWAGATPATNESTTIANPTAGTHYITLTACGSFSNIKTTATYTVHAPTPTPTSSITALANGVASPAITAAQGSNTLYSVTVPTGMASLTINTTGTNGDDDFYVKLGSQPVSTGNVCSWNAGDYLWKGATAATDESTTIANPVAGTYYITLAACGAFSNVTTKATYTTTAQTSVVSAPVTTPTVTPTSTSGAVGPTISTFTASGPITVSSGQTITGLAISNPSGPCISGSGVSNVHIYNNKIGPCGPAADGTGVNLSNVHDVLVDHNSFDDVAGGFLVSNATNNIVFDHNYATRIRGPYPRGQIAQFNEVNGSGNKITCNVSDQTTPGYGDGTEDHINTWLSSGTASSPILIQYNKLRGGGPSQSGGGIIAGDGGGSYITVDTNILINPGQYGVAVAGGHDNRLLNNKVYSASFPWSNVGTFVWNQYAPTAYNEEVSGNHVNWTNRDNVENNWWGGGNSGTVSMSNNVFGDLTIGPDIWDQTFTQCAANY